MLVVSRRSNETILCHSEEIGNLSMEILFCKKVFDWYMHVKSNSTNILHRISNYRRRGIQIYAEEKKYTGKVFIEKGRGQIRLAFDFSPDVRIIRKETLTPIQYVMFLENGEMEFEIEKDADHG